MLTSPIQYHIPEPSTAKSRRIFREMVGDLLGTAYIPGRMSRDYFKDEEINPNSVPLSSRERFALCTGSFVLPLVNWVAMFNVGNGLLN